MEESSKMKKYSLGLDLNFDWICEETLVLSQHFSLTYFSGKILMIFVKAEFYQKLSTSLKAHSDGRS